MADRPRPLYRAFHVIAYRHQSSDLLTAVSDDLRGLAVVGRSPGEVQGRIGEAIREVLEADGSRVRGVSAERIAEPAAVEAPVPGLVDARLQFYALAQVDAV